MSRALRRYLALLLSFLLAVTAAPFGALAEGSAETAEPTAEVIEAQTAEPTASPTPTPAPMEEPTSALTAEPIGLATAEITAEPSAAPTDEPVVEPSAVPTDEPVAEPSAAPTDEPVAEPSAAPTDEPVAEPTADPTEEATAEPTSELTPGPSPAAALSIALDAGDISLYIGETRVLSARVEPEDAAVPSLLWTSSDDAVATVDANGVVLAVSPGTATILATARDESGLTAECAVTVPQPISTLSVTGKARIQVGNSYPFAAQDGEAAVPEGILVWTSSDEAIATVDGAGIVTGVSIGTAVITAAAMDGSGLTFSFPVEVLRATVVIRTKSNKQFSRAVCENNEDAEDTIANAASTTKAGSAEFQLMRLVLKTNGTDPDVAEYNPDIIIANNDNRYLIQFTTVAETQAAYEALSQAKYVKYIEPDTLTSISTTSYTYNSWGVDAMNADVASEYLATQTSASLKVAVVDSGISPHSFIGSKLINGYDYVDNDNDPADENGHGTHVAGTIVDMTQALNVYVVAYRTFDAQGSGYTSNIVNAIMVAADDGCKVINLSARGVYTDYGNSLYSNAISYAVNKGATFCCAAGNDYGSTSNYVPACITISGCIVVASVGTTLTHSSFSNTGSSVDVSAPGESIKSCDYLGGFCTMSGTSMATPHISAACAIIKLAHPSYSPSQVEAALKDLCTDLGSTGYDTTYGYGIPDLSAIAEKVPTAIVVTAPHATLAAGSGMQLTATISPSTADQTLIWTSSDESVLTVSESGYVTAIMPGNARITATTVNNLTGYVDLTVPYDAATGVVVTAPQTTVAVGGGMQLAATVSPATADPTVTWSSSDNGIMTVSASGYVTAVMPGKVRITATTVNNLTGYVDLTVPYDAATGVVVTAPQTTVALGGGMQLAATVSPATADPAVTWSSSDSTVMTVSVSGYVTAVMPGKVRITATTVNNLTGYVDLTVPYDAATGVVVTAPQTTVALGGGMQLVATVSPATAEPVVKWSSSNSTVMTVSVSGYVTAVKPGNARITATTVNDLTAYVDLTVPYDAATGVVVTAPQTTVAVGSGMQLAATISPATANPTVTWGSSDSGVMTVSASGYVTAVKPGNARITATTVNNLTGYVDLTIPYDAATGMVVNAPQTTVAVGSGMQLAATVSPATANPAVTWSSTDNSIMTVSASGYVTAVKPGNARITATTVNNLTGYVDLTVPYDTATGVVVATPHTTLGIGAIITLTATVSPATADPTVTWTSSNAGIASVTTGGSVTAIAPGTVRITAKTVNNLTGYVDLTVTQDMPTSVVVTAPSATLTLGSHMSLTDTVLPFTANQTVTWSSSDTDVLTVSASGYITPVATGTARITAETINNLTSSVDLTVTYDTATGVAVTAPSSTLTLGSHMTLTAAVSPSTADQAVTWSSSDTGVLTVSANGSVTPVATGTARVTAKTVNNLTGSVDLTVTYDTATGVAVTAPSSTLTLGSHMTLTAVVSPATADQAVTWSSSDTGVLTVSANGYLTPVATGTARVTAKTVNNLTGYADLTVTYDTATGVAVIALGSTLTLGSRMTLTATVSPATANQAVTWTSSNTGVLTVSASGSVTPRSTGTARVTATTVNNLTGYVDLTVIYDTATRVAVVAPNSTLTLGSRVTLTATVSPATANQAVTWSSSDTGVLTVSASGYVTPRSTGTARVTAKTVNNLTGYIDLTVTYDAATGVVVTASSPTLILGSHMTLTAAVSPSTANQAVTWSSSNTGVLAVSASGYLTTVSIGTARITATAAKNIYGYVDVTVIGATPASIDVSASKAIVEIGESMQLSVALSPRNADPTVTWTSSNSGVLTVSASGTVKGVASGTARITARTSNNLTAYIDFTVGARLSDESIVLGKREKYQLSVIGNAGKIVWASANPSIAMVSSAGLVTGKKVGTTQITATVDGLTLTCTVRVSKPVLSQSYIKVSALTKYKLSVSYTTQSIRWRSSRTSVATVNSNGKITARKPGTATIYATVDGYKLKCTVKVATNGHSYSVDMSAGNYEYGASVAVGKVYYKGSTIYMDIYLVNNYSKKMIYRLDKLKISVNDEETGTLLAKKTFTKLYVRLKPGKVKKITLKFSGSATKQKAYELRLRTQTFYTTGSLTLK